jgi:hypothetical protein
VIPGWDTSGDTECCGAVPVSHSFVVKRTSTSRSMKMLTSCPRGYHRENATAHPHHPAVAPPCFYSAVSPKQTMVACDRSDLRSAIHPVGSLKLGRASYRTEASLISKLREPFHKICVIQCMWTHGHTACTYLTGSSLLIRHRHNGDIKPTTPTPSHSLRAHWQLCTSLPGHHTR